MKQLCILFLLCVSISFANNTNPTTSSVKAVTVFVDGEQVTRSAFIYYLKLQKKACYIS